MNYLERLRNRQSGMNGTKKSTQPYNSEPQEPLKGPYRGFRGSPQGSTQLFFDAKAGETANRPRLADIPEIPKGGTPQPVEAWTPSGKRLVVTAYSEEHAEQIRRMNPPPDSTAKSEQPDKRELTELPKVPFVSFDSAPQEGTQLFQDDADRREAFEERAAIMEYDGGLSRQKAEQKAAKPKGDGQRQRYRQTEEFMNAGPREFGPAFDDDEPLF